MNEELDQQAKTMAIVAYLTVIGLIVALVMNQEKKYSFTSFHIRQALGILLTALALSLVAVIPILGWIVSILGWIAVVVLWVIGLMNAVNGVMKPVPGLGQKFEEWFEGVG